MSYNSAIGVDRDALNERLIDATVTSSQRSVGRAYLYWFIGCNIGAHNFYLGKPLLGAAQVFALLLVVVTARLGAPVALLALPALGYLMVSVIVDAFLIPARVRSYGDRLRARLIAETEWGDEQGA